MAVVLLCGPERDAWLYHGEVTKGNLSMSLENIQQYLPKYLLHDRSYVVIMKPDIAGGGKICALKGDESMTQQKTLEEIARCFYERSGKIEGRDLDNWLMAERYVRVWYGAGKTEKEIPVRERRRISLPPAVERRRPAVAVM